MAGGNANDVRSLALTPTWSVATVLTVFVAISLVVERSIHHLSQWLHKTKRKPLFAAVEKMKEELMLLGFISLMLTATSSSVSKICIKSRHYEGKFAPCARSKYEESTSHESDESTFNGHKLLELVLGGSARRALSGAIENTCKQGHEPFISFQGMEQLHRFIFVMAITHVFYSCLTMLLAIVKIYTWREWENEAHSHDSLTVVWKLVLSLSRATHGGVSKKMFETTILLLLFYFTRELTMRRQSTFVKAHTSSSWSKNRFFVWVISFFRQFGHSVAQADYLTLRMGFLTNHNLTAKYDFHSYMIRSMEDEFKVIVGISEPLWGFVVAFMLFNVHGSNLYFWISFIPIILVLLVGMKLQHVIATLALENVGVSGSFLGATKLKPRDELFWLNKPELLLSLIHFILFQNAFELASFFWFWWQFGYDSCFLDHHLLVYIRLIFGFAGQFLCSYITLPLYALVTQMGTNYKAALIPARTRETIHGWRKAARRKRRLGAMTDDSTVRSIDSTTIHSSEDCHKSIHYSSDNEGSSSKRHHNEIEYYLKNDQIEIEMQTAHAASMVASGSLSPVHIPQHRNSASLPPESLEYVCSLDKFPRSLT